MGDTAGTYAGDVSAKEAWGALASNGDAVLIDVRTRAEWQFVGTPDLSSIGKTVILAEWQSFPTGEVDPDFASRLGAELGTQLGTGAKDAPVYFLCRSGARSRAAAIALTAEGFSRCFNVAGGFEGDLDTEKHRGTRNGWKVAGLPWMQT